MQGPLNNHPDIDNPFHSDHVQPRDLESFRRAEATSMGLSSHPETRNRARNSLDSNIRNPGFTSNGNKCHSRSASNPTLAEGYMSRHLLPYGRGWGAVKESFRD
jgi:hypothetical protein